MASRLGAVALTVQWCEVIYQYVMIPCTPGEAECATQLRDHPVDHKWYHIVVPVGVPSVSTQCLGLLRVLEPS